MISISTIATISVLPVTGVVTALQSPHFRKYKEQAQPMVKSLTLLDTDPIPHCSKLK